MTTPHDHPRDWWQRPGLEARGGRLLVAGRDAETLAREHGTPLFVYDLTHIEENVRALQGAMARTGLPWKVRWALKSQREPEVLARLHALGTPGTPEFVGLDVCSPGEVDAGGGLGAVMRQGQRPLDRDAYAGILARHLGPLGVTIACEPGEMFCRNAGVLLAEVVTVEDRSQAGVSAE